MAFDPATAANYNQNEFTADAVNADAVNDSALEAQRKAEAEAAGVQDARFIGYAEVLAVYNRRSDTEPLAERRARALAADPSSQDFARKADYDGNNTQADTVYPNEDLAWSSDYTAPYNK